MDETIVIEILRDVLTGENTERVPLNTYIASTKSKTKAEIPDQGKPCLCQAATAHAGTIPKTTAHLCVSDSEDEDDGEADEATVKWSKRSSNMCVAEDDDWDFSSIPEPHPEIRRNKQILQQLRDNEKEGLQKIAALAAAETATIPNLVISNSKVSRGWTKASQNLSTAGWAGVQGIFAGTINDEKTGESLEYQELIKRPKKRESSSDL